jgi:putative ABC transport system substrate-binding protein
MKRRDFITLVCGGMAWPTATWAQQQAMPVIGYLDAGEPLALGEPFRKGLSETGYVEGRNVAIDYRAASNDRDRLAELARDLVRRRVAVIVADASPLTAADAVKAANSTIPIVFLFGGDPVERGFVASLNRPGGNITGVTYLNAALEAKRLELLHELVPGATRPALLVSQSTSAALNESHIRVAQAAAAAIGLPIEVVSVASDREIDASFASLARQKLDALIVDNAPLFSDRSVQLAALAARYKVPAIYPWRESSEGGGLMSYGAALKERDYLNYQVGVYVGRILNGAKPADLPVVQSSKFELVINLKTAKALGIEVPTSILLRADEVIE